MHQLTSFSVFSLECGTGSEMPIFAAIGCTTKVTICFAPSDDSGSVDKTDWFVIWLPWTEKQKEDQSLYILSHWDVLSSLMNEKNIN